ncbi:MAG: Coq4 family protein, partial [Polyangiaceae bacterium]
MRVFDHLFQVGAYARGALAFARVVKDPDRLDDVFQFIDHGISKQEAFIAPILAAFRTTAEGARSVRDKVRVGRLDLDVLAKCPPGSLGAAFAEHMRKNGLDPAALPRRAATTESEYVVAHLY